MQPPQKIKAPEALLRMLQRYELKSTRDYKSAIQEVAQEIALLGLWRAKFFEKAAFYGGTALRILHQLDRFSEDLDFSLLRPDPHFDIARYEKAVQEELQSLGFTAHVEKKKKTQQSAIESAFIKMNTLQHLFWVGLPQGLGKGIHPEELIKIRFEVDTDPPCVVTDTENVLLLLPSPFSVKTFRLEDLFAGKMHALLCREWKGRVKGRDWYDFVWFVSREIPIHLNFLEKRMRQSGHWMSKENMTEDDLSDLLDQKIMKLDVSAAREDIINFIKNPSQIKIWSREFFQQIAQRIKIV